LCIAPIDVPLVPRAVFEALLAAWRRAAHPPRGWLAPRHSGRFGHPIVLGREIAAELAHLEKDAPLRDLRARAAPLLAVDVQSSEVLDDLDSQDDLARLRAKLSRG
jgi:molybdenum cofactor cytidylyltransferase